MKRLTFLVVTCLLLSISSARKRTRTTSTTTEQSYAELEQTLADRELSLNEREEAFRTREAVFRSREEKLTIREDAFQEREDKLSKREQNIERREKNTLRGSCKDVKEDGDGAPPPDYSIVRYDETGKLRDIGDIGSCSDNMRFFASADNETTGSCECDYHQCGRPLLYSDKYKQCFWAWSQGPCEQQEWYVFDDNLVPVCEPNPCPASIGVGVSAYYFQYPEDGKCYKAGSKGPCLKGERLFTTPEDPIPKCRKQATCPAQSIPPVLQCFPGNNRTFQGQCNAKEELE